MRWSFLNMSYDLFCKKIHHKPKKLTSWSKKTLNQPWFYNFLHNPKKIIKGTIHCHIILRLNECTWHLVKNMSHHTHHYISLQHTKKRVSTRYWHHLSIGHPSLSSCSWLSLFVVFSELSVITHEWHIYDFISSHIMLLLLLKLKCNCTRKLYCSLWSITQNIM